jgi:hypothetical protein
MFAGAIRGSRTRELLHLIYANGGDRILPYVFGMEDGRHFASTSLEPLSPAHQLWSGRAALQNARTLLDRAQATLRTHLLLSTASHDDDLFLRFLFKFGLDESWRKGTVDRLSAVRDQLKSEAPEEAEALSELTKPALRRVVTLMKDLRFHRRISKGGLPLFTSVYSALRYVGLFSRQGLETADLLRAARSNLPQAGSPETLMLQRALERPLHLLQVPEEWDSFITQLLDWIDDPKGGGAVFASYTACYYQNSLDQHTWQGMVDPLSNKLAWSKEALHAVLEESNKNLSESWYQSPHHAVINVLRAVNYLRAHPNPRLGQRERVVCLCLSRAGMAAASRLSHPRVNKVRRWSEWLEKGVTQRKKSSSCSRVVLQ